jgi:hypothetical protein
MGVRDSGLSAQTPQCSINFIVIALADEWYFEDITINAIDNTVLTR